MKKLYIILSGIILLVLCIFCISALYHKAKFHKSAKLAIEYIQNHTEPNGRFVYKTSINSKARIDNKKYNSLRHAGTLYSMYLYERYLKDKSYADTRYLASEYYIKRYIKPAGKNMYAAISLPEDEEVKYEVAKLGATGLALSALSNLYKDGKIDLEVLEGLGNFLIYMQKPDGSFYSKYNPASGTREDVFVSIYYPGEAALGLLYLNEVNPSEKWVIASKKALLYIAKNNTNKKMIFDHWSALATKKLLETPENTLTPEEKQLLKKYGHRLADSIIFSQNLDKGNRFFGGFGQYKLCSTGTILEGLSALYYVVDDENLKKRIKISLDAGSEFLAKYQVKDGKFAGGIPNSAYWLNEKFTASHQVIRIDYVQHCLSAWILYSVMK